MKLSNKILIGFFGIMFLYLTAVFAEIRLRGMPNIINDTNSIAETVDIPSVTHVVLRDVDKAVYVVGSDKPRLEVRSFSGNLLQSVKHVISGDTLIVFGLRSQDIQMAKISVFVPRVALEQIKVDSAEAIVSGLNLDRLGISQSAGRIRLSDSRITTIHINASAKSYLDVTTTEVDTLSAHIEESEMLISSPVGRMEGSMKNNSYLRVHDLGNIEFTKDKTSRFNLYQ